MKYTAVTAKSRATGANVRIAVSSDQEFTTAELNDLVARAFPLPEDQPEDTVWSLKVEDDEWHASALMGAV
jgi:hypothetical protein